MFKLSILLLVMALFIGCESDSTQETSTNKSSEATPTITNNNADATQTTTEIITTEEANSSPKQEADPIPDAKLRSEKLYLSYDDSASTASVKLVKYYFKNEIPAYIPASLGRSWEFLNYENFDISELKRSEPFSISMGLVKSEESNQSFYELGVHITSDTLSN
jgi:hypothetical protein